MNNPYNPPSPAIEHTRDPVRRAAAALALVLLANAVLLLQNSHFPFPSIVWIKAVGVAFALVLVPGAVLGMLVWMLTGRTFSSLRSAIVWSSMAIGLLRLLFLVKVF